MSSKTPTDSLPAQETSLTEMLHRLTTELNQCTDTLRETHEQIGPQLEMLEKRFLSGTGTQPETENPLIRRDPLRFP